MSSFSIAIDGPAGAGKSTITKMIAMELGIEYVDTGAMYRAITLKVMRAGLDIADEAALFNILKSTDIDFRNGHVYLDGQNVDSEIREDEVTKRVSEVAAIKMVRDEMVEKQREIASNKPVIMDGRDIGTNVLKDSRYKFYLDASIEERAKRRYNEIKDRGVSLAEVMKDISDRDEKDKNRTESPLRKADDALLVDTTHMTIAEVKDFVIEHVERDKGLVK